MGSCATNEVEYFGTAQSHTFQWASKSVCLPSSSHHSSCRSEYAFASHAHIMWGGALSLHSAPQVALWFVAVEMSLQACITTTLSRVTFAFENWEKGRCPGLDSVQAPFLRMIHSQVMDLGWTRSLSTRSSSHTECSPLSYAFLTLPCQT